MCRRGSSCLRNSRTYQRPLHCKRHSSLHMLKFRKQNKTVELQIFQIIPQSIVINDEIKKFALPAGQAENRLQDSSAHFQMIQGPD